MEKGTSISKDFLDNLTKKIKEKYRVDLWFAEILGNRWSYLTGKREIFNYFTERIQINEKLGMVINNEISEDKKKEILDLIRKKIKGVG